MSGDAVQSTREDDPYYKVGVVLRPETLPLISALRALDEQVAFHKRAVRQHRKRLAECAEARGKLLDVMEMRNPEG